MDPSQVRGIVPGLKQNQTGKKRNASRVIVQSSRIILEILAANKAGAGRIHVVLPAGLEQRL